MNIKNYNGELFDIVIIDSTDFNQAESLFTEEFYQNVKKILKESHLVCFNADNLNWNEENIVDMVRKQKKFLNL